MTTEPTPPAPGLAVAAHLCGWSWVVGVPGLLPALVVWLLARRNPGARRHASLALRFQLIVAVAALAAWLLVLSIGGVTGLIWVAPELGLAGYVVAWLSLIPSTLAALSTARGGEARYPLAGTSG